MSFEIVFVFGLIVLAMVLFSLSSVGYDVVAMLLMCTLMLTGILDTKEGLSGFANPATITIAAMFALSEGIRKTGLLRTVGRFLGRIEQFSTANAVMIVMGIVAVVSAFINNTAAVVILIPVIIRIATHMEQSPSKMLMPLSFASMFGGVCTLLGTSTNILVSSIAADNELKPFSMFEFTPFGLIVVATGFLYIYLLGIRLTPSRRDAADLSQDFKTVDYISDVQIKGNYSHLGESLQAVKGRWELDIEVIYLYRDDELFGGDDDVILREKDILRIRGSANEIHKLIQRRPGLEVSPARDWNDVNLAKGDYELIEAVVAPDSDYDARKIKDVGFAENYAALVLGVFKKGHPEQHALNDIALRGGDSVLLALRDKHMRSLKQDNNFVIVSDVSVEHYEKRNTPIVLTILLGVVFSAAFNLVPIVVSACSGVVLLILTGCLYPKDIYSSINWRVIMLLAGVIPLGVAMQKTGAARLLSDIIVDTLGHLGPRAVLSGYFLVTMLLTAMISNQATAAIFAALAIETANGLGVQARPFLMAVTFAASLSLITPWGYQTNTLIYGPGRYHFSDFTKMGAPLNLIFWILGTIFIPLFWHF